MSERLAQLIDVTQATHARTLLTAAGYVEDTSERPGTYVLRLDDVDGRSGQQTFWLELTEDPARPVVSRLLTGWGGQAAARPSRPGR